MMATTIMCVLYTTRWHPCLRVTFSSNFSLLSTTRVVFIHAFAVAFEFVRLLARLTPKITLSVVFGNISVFYESNLKTLGPYFTSKQLLQTSQSSFFKRSITQ